MLLGRYDCLSNFILAVAFETQKRVARSWRPPVTPCDPRNCEAIPGSRGDPCLFEISFSLVVPIAVTFQRPGHPYRWFITNLQRCFKSGTRPDRRARGGRRMARKGSGRWSCLLMAYSCSNVVAPLCPYVFWLRLKKPRISSKPRA